MPKTNNNISKTKRNISNKQVLIGLCVLIAVVDILLFVLGILLL